MDWSNERYVRLYVRDLPDWKLLPWQARALFPLLLKVVDRAGILETKAGPRGVAAAVDVPLEVVGPGLEALIADGCVREIENGYLLPNYLDAQESSKSDRLRQQESRANRRAKALTPNTTSQTVTGSHATSHADTNGHSVQCSAVPYSAVPSSAVPSSKQAGTTTTTATALCIAANSAIAERYGEQVHPLLPTSGHASKLAAFIAEHGVPLEEASATIRDRIAYRDDDDPPRSMGWFRDAILDDWRRKQAIDAARDAPVPPSVSARVNGHGATPIAATVSTWKQQADAAWAKPLEES